MGRRVIDLTGQRFGKLVVIEQAPSRGSQKRAYWRAVCDCGNETVVRSNNLRSGQTKSCGCHMGRSYAQENEGTGDNLQTEVARLLEEVRLRDRVILNLVIAQATRGVA